MKTNTANAALIVRAVNEHAALVAVTEALLRAEADMQHWGLMPVEGIKLRQKMCLENTIRPALAALAAVGKGGAK